ncbi:hypothetical protein U3516DRAFT_809934 [Neocallimastix sp. 'constans']|jgi:magnesium-transporting ATPase (P-type)
MIINQDNIYIQTIIYGLIWAIICFLFYNVANENKNEEKKEKISTLNAYANRILIPEKYQKIAYPLISFIFSGSVFIGLKFLSKESGYDYQILIPSIQLMLLIHYACFAFFWITLFNKQNQKAYFLSSVLFITVLFIYFAIININEENIEGDNIQLKEISNKPTIFIIISIIINFYLIIISMIYTAAENKKGILSYLGDALMKIFNTKPSNQTCPTNIEKKIK